MEAARKNPEKYKGKGYKTDCGAYDNAGSNVTELYIGTDGDFRSLRNGFRVHIGFETVLEEIKQPIPFPEAVKAAIDGKKPTIELGGSRYVLMAIKSPWDDIGYWLRVMYDDDRAELTTGMIDGMWTVEE
jgi:hypothetical protein